MELRMNYQMVMLLVHHIMRHNLRMMVHIIMGQTVVVHWRVIDVDQQIRS